MKKVKTVVAHISQVYIYNTKKKMAHICSYIRSTTSKSILKQHRGQ